MTVLGFYRDQIIQIQASDNQIIEFSFVKTW